MFEVPGSLSVEGLGLGLGLGDGWRVDRVKREGKGEVHIPIHPLRLLQDVQTGVDDELVHVLRCIWEPEPRDAVAAALGGAEGEVEEGDVGGGEDGEVVGHFAPLWFFPYRSGIGSVPLGDMVEGG